MQADSKINPSLLSAAEASTSLLESIATQCSITAYKTRALKQIISQPAADTITST
jgi:hypothetical protein